MTVAIDARAAVRPELGGVERWARELRRRLPALRPGGYEVLAPRPALSHRAGHLWEQAYLPWAARDASWLLCPANLAPLAHPRTAVVLHDAAPLRDPSWYSSAYVRWQRAVLPRIVERAALVITVSEFSRRELGLLLGVDAKVVPGGVDHDRFAPLPGDAPPGDYVLTVASATSRKNLAALGETARRLRARGLRLVIAGGDRPQFAGEPSLSTADAVGHVPDDELPALYANALAFVLPSRYEGFGLTALEAMASGTPVVCSTAGALPEVCGDAARYADTAPELADAVDEVLADPAPWRARGVARAQAFSWERTAREVDALLHP